MTRVVTNRTPENKCQSINFKIDLHRTFLSIYSFFTPYLPRIFNNMGNNFKFLKNQGTYFKKQKNLLHIAASPFSFTLYTEVDHSQYCYRLKILRLDVMPLYDWLMVNTAQLQLVCVKCECILCASTQQMLITPYISTQSKHKFICSLLLSTEVSKEV